ncbi:MAG: hypothetical protein MJ239_00335 [Bacilli bacterium]|nr:hypothetical protein [Bacilli bacterium]
MKPNSSPNNEKWGVVQTLLPNKSCFEYDEYNNIKIKDIPAAGFDDTKEVTGYSNGDLGSSLQETKYASVTNSTRIKKIIGGVAKVGVAALAVVSIFSIVQQGIPKLSNVEVYETSYRGIQYSFSATVKYEAAIVVMIENGGDRIILEEQIVNSDNPAYFVGYYSGDYGDYELTIKYDGSFGNGSIYSKKGVLR